MSTVLELATDEQLIAAAKESGLWQEYEGDPVLRRFYMHRLLKWGWAGQMTDTEALYVKLVRRAVGKTIPPRGAAAKLARSQEVSGPGGDANLPRSSAQSETPTPKVQGSTPSRAERRRERVGL